MRIIPLHSIVITVGTSNIIEASVLEKFPQYEIINKSTIAENIFGSSDKKYFNDILNYELYRIINLKLSHGERVVLSGNNLNRNKRINISNLGKKYNIPVYYLITHDEGVSLDRNKIEFFNLNKESILNGDGIANVIEVDKEEFSIINKPPVENLISFIKDAGFKGITVAGDVHGNVEALRNSLDWSLARNHFYIQLGDLIDYGAYPIECVELIYDRIIRGKAINIIGNHERKLERWLQQEKNIRHNPDYLKYKTPVLLSDSNRKTIELIKNLPYNSRRVFENKFNTLMNFGRNHINLSNVILTHAAISNEMFDINSHRLYGKFESLALYGETSSSSHDSNYINSYDWVDNIPNNKIAIVGHVIKDRVFPQKIQNSIGGEVIFLDTGSGKGGGLSTIDMNIVDNNLNIQSFNKW